MRKLTTLLCVLLLTAALSVTVFAKPSPEGGKTKAYDAFGKELKILKIEQDEWTESQECNHGQSCEGIMELLTPVSPKYSSIMDTLDIMELISGTKYEDKEWIKMYEMEIVAKECVEFPVKLTFDREDWAEGMPLAACYMPEEDGWRIIMPEEENGVYSVKFDSADSLSVMAFFMAQENAEEMDAPIIANDRLFTIVIASTIAIGLVGTNLIFRKRP